MTPTQREREAVIAALFPSASPRPRVFRVRLRVRTCDGHLLRFFIDETGRATIIGCAPTYLHLFSAGRA